MYEKIDIFASGVYICSTNQAKNVKEAKDNFLKNPCWQGLKSNGLLGEITLSEWLKANGGWSTHITCNMAE